MNGGKLTCGLCFRQRETRDLFTFIVSANNLETGELEDRTIVICNVCSEKTHKTKSKRRNINN